MAKAELVKDFGFNGTAHWKLYKVSPSLKEYSWDDDEDETPESYEYIVVSAANVMYSGPETYIFGADSDGEIVNWLELPGSFKGALDHNEALKRAGYTEIL